MPIKLHQSQSIRAFLIEHLEERPRGLAALAAKRFRVTKQAVHHHLKALVKEGAIEAVGGPTSKREYRLQELLRTSFSLQDIPSLREDAVWIERVRPIVTPLARENVLRIIDYGFTEMLNNAIDHSKASEVMVTIAATAATLEIDIYDNGVGVFEKIRSHFHLDNIKHAIFELAKGKLTTDATKHSGQGIFFTSRLFDWFALSSDRQCYIRLNEKAEEDWLIEKHDQSFKGTSINMKISRFSKRDIKVVFDRYSSKEDYSFSKTHVPVKLAAYEGENLVSRSQAKRILARFDKFEEIFLDFKGIANVGQAFMDEIFRVYQNQHPGMKIVWAHVNREVESAIKKAVSEAAKERGESP
jgi:anti-sigma regulatory factor (Ser/Thr protein kinase)